MYIRFGKRHHRGGLKESLETIVYIDEHEFNLLLPKYHFYALDERCNQIVFIFNDLEHSYINHDYEWLFIEYDLTKRFYEIH